ncbi:MAG: fibronectin type III domain-containing protein, partial [Clostridiales Family XIII bacterium]|nr:fibronectin type III domain-containing protein [Clostridiales Family XIII bacterium]
MRRRISLLCVILMLVTVFAPIAPVSAATASDMSTVTAPANVAESDIFADILAEGDALNAGSADTDEDMFSAGSADADEDMFSAGSAGTEKAALRAALKAALSTDSTPAAKEAAHALIIAAIKGEDITAALATAQATSKPAPAESSFVPQAVVRALSSSAATPTDITEKFTDEKFLAAVKKIVGKESDEAIYDTDVAPIVELTIDGLRLDSLDGIEYFNSLAYLSCYWNNLTELDLSANTSLERLDCGGNNLTELDLSANTSLEWLYCDDNNLTNLDLSANAALEWLYCGDNNLTELDLSANTALETLVCLENNLTELDLSANTALETLVCLRNNLTELDLSANTALERLICWENNLTELDLSANTALIELDCGDNNLTELDLSANTALTYLYCGYNRLTELDLSANTALIELDCYNNKLTELDLSANTDLSFVGCSGNYFRSKDAIIGLSSYAGLDFIPQHPLEPLPPENVAAEYGDKSAVVSFAPPSAKGGDGGRRITSYTVTASPGGITASGIGSPITVTGLTNGRPYTFTVTATNRIGESAPSEPSEAVIRYIIPNAPERAAAEYGDKSAVVSFAPPSAEGGDGGRPITSYTVTASPGGITVSGIESPLTVVGLTNGVPYTFTVTATNEIGESSPSEPSEVVIPRGIPDASDNVALVKTEAELKAALKSATVTYIRLEADITLKKNDATYTVSPSKPRLTIDGIGSDGVRHILKENKDNSSGTSAIGVRSAKAKLS